MGCWMITELRLRMLLLVLLVLWQDPGEGLSRLVCSRGVYAL